MEKRIWTKEEIAALLTSEKTARVAVERGLMSIYDYQTRDEKDAQIAKYDNKVGFSGAHAEFCSSLAEWLKKGGHLSQKQFTCAQKIMAHYAGQLTRIANGENE